MWGLGQQQQRRMGGIAKTPAAAHQARHRRTGSNAETQVAAHQVQVEDGVGLGSVQEAQAAGNVQSHSLAPEGKGEIEGPAGSMTDGSGAEVH